jgi:hypothetical protein
VKTKLSVLTVGAALALSLSASVIAAKPVTVAPGTPPVTVEVPQGWQTSKIDRGIQAKTADEEVLVWFESYRPAQLETLLAEHNAYYKEQGVTINGQDPAEEKEFPTYSVKVTDYKATYEGKPTVLRYVSVASKDPSKRRLLVSVWASPEGSEKYDKDLNAIFNSFRASVEGL